MERKGSVKSLLRSTAGDRAGSIDGINLFFGALLGANLGTMQTLPLLVYVQIILVLVAGVMIIRMISTSERRWFVLASAVVLVPAIGAMFFIPMLKPRGLPEDAQNKLLATLAIWLVCVLLVEFQPAHKES
jgi:asparagine N-glycosylation enzyme membrane subunit Stt3